MTTDFTIAVGDGWTDIDGDSTLFFFSVKEANLDRIRLNARGLSDVYSYMFKLTEGTFIRIGLQLLKLLFYFLVQFSK